VVPDAELAAEAQKLAETLAAGPTRAFAGVKRLLVSSGSESPESQMELESQAISRAAEEADGKEGIAAFLAKRVPVFKGA
jgi:2-(1,2-epoxy-1,2-dihydrophenyl)acetyl-CoA isomerase